jgi:hypothetical protein
MLRLLSLLLAIPLLAAPCLAQEPVGCDNFKWPIDKERALLAQAAPVSSGGIAAPSAGAFKLPLAPLVVARLPVPPSRAPRAGTNAGFVHVAAPQKTGTYRITLSDGAWIDVVQDGHEVRSTAFTGATGCAGVRKSVKFPLAATPFVIEISGATAPSIDIVVTPD